MDTTTGEALLDLLKDNGVDLVFGVPGNHTVALYRGFADAGIRHVTCRHEQGAAFMADGYARATGRPGVCVLISGPGLLNAATAIAQARADSVPMLVISGVASVRDLGMQRGTLHELPDQHATAASFCRSSATVLDPDNLAELVARAFALFKTQRPGPAHIEIPLDLMDAPVTDSTVRAPAVLGAPGPHPEVLSRAAELLASADRPLMVLGGGAQNAAEAVSALAEAADCPVLNTVNGKGVLAIGHPLAVGGSPSQPALRDAMADSDVLLAIGTEMAETDYDLLMAAPLAEHPRLIRIDIDPEQLLIPHPPALGLVCDAEAAARALADRLLARSLGDGRMHESQREGGQSPGSERAAALRAAIQTETHYHQEVQAFFAAVVEAAPGAIIVGDSTRPTYYAAWQLERSRPRSYFHSASGFGTLGYALPAAFGAALAGGEPVIALIGDGGIQFTLPELSTAAELELPIPIIVWHNQGYREIENSMRAKNVPVDSTRIDAPDFAATAAAHGAGYALPESLTELTAAIRAALAANAPTLIEVQEGTFLTTPSGGWYQ
jgi:acetolactate synthase-1/2/3 large subunit